MNKLTIALYSEWYTVYKPLYCMHSYTWYAQSLHWPMAISPTSTDNNNYTVVNDHCVTGDDQALTGSQSLSKIISVIIEGLYRQLCMY